MALLRYRHYGGSTGEVSPARSWQGCSADKTNWREIGTGRQCNDTFRCWFRGYGVNGTRNALGTQGGVGNGVQHTFQVQRVFDDAFYKYQFRVDGVLKGVMTSSSTGPMVSAGLESYVHGAGGDFVDWAGEDDEEVGAAMCGESPAGFEDRWRAGQGAGACQGCV